MMRAVCKGLGIWAGCVGIFRSTSNRAQYCRVCRPKHKRAYDRDLKRAFTTKIKPLRAKELPEPYKTWLANNQ